MEGKLPRMRIWICRTLAALRPPTGSQRTRCMLGKLGRQSRRWADLRMGTQLPLAVAPTLMSDCSKQGRTGGG